MALNSAWIYCFIVLWNVVLGCRWMQSGEKGYQSRFREFNNDSILMLREMGHEVTVEENKPAFPNKLYEQAEHLQPEERIMVIYKTTNAITKMYITGKYETVTWEKKKLEKFQLDLDRQASELKQCIQNQKSQAFHSVRRLFRKMEKYFIKLSSRLRSKRYSADGWEIVRSQVLIHLRRLHSLAKNETTKYINLSKRKQQHKQNVYAMK